MLRTLREFGLQRYELPSMIENVAIFLRCLAVNIDNRYKKGIPIINYVLTLSVIASYLYVYFFSVIWFLIVRTPEAGKLVPAMVAHSFGICTSVSVIKLAFMAFNRHEVRSVVDNFLVYDSHVIPGNRFHDNIIKTLKIVKRRAALYWLTLIINAVAYILAPMFMHVPEDFLIIYGLEPMLETPNFEIASVLIISVIFFICFTVASISALTIILVGYVEANMLSLSVEIREIWKDAVADKKENKEYKHLKHQPLKIVNKYIKRRLIKIVKQHTLNISLFNNVEHLFRVPIAVGFLCETIGILAALLGNLDNTFLQLSFAFTQISMDCYIAQKIIDANLKFEEAIYDCSWENFDISNMKFVLMILQNSQKTMRLTAGGIWSLSSVLLLGLIESIYSAFTTLKN